MKNLVRTIRRRWTRLAPKLLAFIASGAGLALAVSGIQAFGIPLAPEPVAIIGGALTTLAAWAKRDAILALPWNMLAPKVIAFALSGVTASAIVALAPYLGYAAYIDAPRAAWLVTIFGLVAGYLTPDNEIPEAIVEYADTDGPDHRLGD